MKYFLTLLLCFPLIGNSQNQSIIEKMVDCETINDIVSVSNKIVNSGKEKYLFFEVKDTYLDGQKRKSVIYTLAKDSDKDTTIMSDKEFETAVVVLWHENENRFSFKEVVAPKEILEPYFHTTFNTNSNYAVETNAKFRFDDNKYQSGITRVE